MTRAVLLEALVEPPLGVARAALLLPEVARAAVAGVTLAVPEVARAELA
ncbi:MAG TPA: hypothetical protein VER33_03110 [Polyangiaceae bacterium]|nr:hypothetical protein [Polyangiaceae bacterium]